MGLHALEEHEGPPPAPPIHFLYPVEETISASGAIGATMHYDVVIGMRMRAADVIEMSYWSSNASANVSVGGMYYTGAGDYDPAFVAEILAADAAPAEEGFDNVVDLLDWLNRD
jgi:hypothetical protein